MRVRRIIVAAALAAAALMLFAVGCAQDDPASPTNEAPRIDTLRLVPGDTLPQPSESVAAVVEAFDPDGDELTYLWTASGGMLTTDDADSVIWTAPGEIGFYTLRVTVSDSLHSVTDSLRFGVALDLIATITTPADSAVFAPGDSIDFAASLQGYTLLDTPDVAIRWESDVDGLLNSGAPDSEGDLAFTGVLSYGVHRVSLTATLDDSVAATDTVTVVNVQPKPVRLYEIERGYVTNRVSWSRFHDPARFGGYIVTRRTAGTAVDTVVARLTTDAGYTVDSRGFVDSSVVIGRTYEYNVRAMNDFGVYAASDTQSIATGVFNLFEDTRIGDLTFTDNSYYLYVSLTDSDTLAVIDVTANNVDYEIPTGDGPWGLAYKPMTDELYVALTGDSSAYVLDLATNAVVDSVSLGGRSALYLAHHPTSERFYATVLNNEFPVEVDESGAAPVVSTIQDPNSRLILDSSFVFIDGTDLYISEIGGYPASLFRFDVSGSPPALVLEDEHNSLGYDMRDVAVVPGANRLLVACRSPYYVQAISSATFNVDYTLDTGPYPNAVAVNPAGTLGFVSTGGDSVQVWDLATQTHLRTHYFEERVVRDGLEVTNDGTRDILVVSTWDAAGQYARLSIIYAP